MWHRYWRRFGPSVMALGNPTRGSSSTMEIRDATGRRLDEVAKSWPEAKTFHFLSNHGQAALVRFDMESGQLLEFNPRFPKICAGIGTFLERDTLSRSLVINMERYTAEESRVVREYFLCTEEVTLPIYQQFLKYWTAERPRAFGRVCREVLKDIPAQIISRQRQKFVPWLATAKLGGKQLFDESIAAIEWFSAIPDTANPALGHRLLCDIARIFHRQVFLHERKAPDPITGKPTEVLYQPTTGVYLMPSQKLVTLLRELPESPWKCYGKDKRSLDDDGLYVLLRDYSLASVKLKIAGATHRGLTYDHFRERYERFRRTGDPSRESVKENWTGTLVLQALLQVVREVLAHLRQTPQRLPDRGHRPKSRILALPRLKTIVLEKTQVRATPRHLQWATS
jgi:uncharacterized protein DUF3631